MVEDFSKVVVSSKVIVYYRARNLILVLTFSLNPEGCDRVCCSKVCFSVWQAYLVRIVQCIAICFCQVHFGSGSSLVIGCFVG